MKNKSGMRPFGHRVLVYPDPVEEKTAGGIILTDQAIESQQMAVARGVLVAVSSVSFDYAEIDENEIPDVGDRVTFGRYDGQTFKNGKGEEYRLLSDQDIKGVEIAE